MGVEVERIKQGMERYQLTYRDMEKATGIGYSVIYRYLNGGTDKIPMEAIVKMSKAVHETPEHILGWDENLTPEEQERRQKINKLYELVENLSIEQIDKIINAVKLLM